MKNIKAILVLMSGTFLWGGVYAASDVKKARTPILKAQFDAQEGDKVKISTKGRAKKRGFIPVRRAPSDDAKRRKRQRERRLAELERRQREAAANNPAPGANE